MFLFPFLGTRDEHTWGSRETMNFWKHDTEGEADPSSSGALELVRQDGCSFFPLQKEYLSALRRSWEDGNCHDGGNCRWARPTTISATRLGTRRSRDRHLFRSVLSFGFGLAKLTEGIDLTIEDVENAWACSDGFKLRVVVASKEAIGLKLLESVEPLLSVIIEHDFGMYDGNIMIRKFRRVGVRDCESVVPAFVELWIIPSSLQYL
jgi:hypothetical protein